MSAPMPTFFAVSKWKLAAMSIATLGLYDIFWFYKNWKCVQQLDNGKMPPIIPAFFYPLTSYWLFKRIREQAESEKVSVEIDAGPLAGVVLVAAYLFRLPDPYWLLAFAGFLPLVPVQAAVNQINRKVAPGLDPNDRFSRWNLAAIVIGGLVLCLAILGLFIEE
jgi:hypothetical protein